MRRALMFLLLAAGGCFDLSFTTDAGILGAVDGTVEDTAGNPLAGVRVRGLMGETTSDARGAFRLPSLSEIEDHVQLSLAGYVSTTRKVTAVPGAFLPVVMAAEAEALPLNATAGGTVQGARGARLTVPARAFVDELGGAVEGAITVSLTPLDPAVPAELQAYPGDFSGIGSEGPVLLQTWGVLAVEARQNGLPLQLAPGASAELRLPAPSSGDKPERARFWIFDDDSGLWMERGMATYEPQTNTFVATTTHLSKCNIDEPIDPYCVRGLVQDKNGRGAVGASVRFDGLDYFGQSRDITDLDGSFCMTVRMNSQVRLTAQKGGDKTERVLTTGDVRATYPPMCAAARCRDLGSITLGAPPSSDDGGVPVDCTKSGADDPFWGTCADGMSDLFRCFQPSGACHYSMDMFQQSFTLTFENGSRMELTFSDITGEMDGQLYGPGGRLCGSMTASEDGMSITPTGGSSYRIGTTAKGGTTITCPSGQTFTLTAAQRDEMSCAGETPSGGDPGSSACTPAPGSLGGSCTGLDCQTDLRCCSMLGGHGVCLDEASCEAYQDYGCVSDTDCLRPERCCAAGYFKMCMDVATCY